MTIDKQIIFICTTCEHKNFLRGESDDMINIKYESLTEAYAHLRDTFIHGPVHNIIAVIQTRD